MEFGKLKVAGYALSYLVLCSLPLGVAVVGPVPAGRGFGLEFGVALGFVGLAMMAAQFFLIGRIRRLAVIFGHDTMLHVHRQAGLAAFGMILAHPAILLVTEPAYLAFLDPRVDLARAVWLSISMVSLVLVVGLTLWRRPIGLGYDAWRASHGVLALLVVGIGLVHVLRVGHYVAAPWKQAVWLTTVGGAMLLLVQVRVIRPLNLRRRPWRVVGVRPERGRSWTIALEPVGHPGLRFEAGQFAWLVLGRSPFSMEQHPFSFASSAAETGRIEFTIKELGDFTGRIGEVPAGETAYVDGPYGTFTLGPEEAGAVFVAGGVGVTPVMSILRTLRDAGDRRPLTVIHGTSSLDSAIFLEELDALRGELDLEVIHVLETPPKGWTGPAGMLDDGMLGGLLPEDAEGRLAYFVCGPGPMMDLVESHLLRRGIPLRQVRSERFDIA